MARVFQRPDRPGWWIEYLDADRRKRREKCRSQKTAQQLLAKRLEEVDRQRKLGTAATRPVTFADFAEIFLADYAPRLVTAWRCEITLDKHFIPAFGPRLLSSITRADIDAWTVARMKVAAPGTVSRELTVLSRMLRIAVEWNYLEAVPKIQRPRVVATRLVFLEADEIRRLLAELGPFHRTLVALLIFTGLRREEALSLTWSDVDLERGIINLVATKNGKARSIPIPYGVVAMLRSHPRDSDHVFHRKGVRYCHSVLYKPLRRACLKAGITKPVTPHTLRHTYASQLVMAGVDLVTVAELLGHSSLSMVRRYAHLSESHRTQAAKRLGAILDTTADTTKTDTTGK